jgi:hypothetical protein
MSHKHMVHGRHDGAMAFLGCCLAHSNRWDVSVILNPVLSSHVIFFGSLGRGSLLDFNEFQSAGSLTHNYSSLTSSYVFSLPYISTMTCFANMHIRLLSSLQRGCQWLKYGLFAGHGPQGCGHEACGEPRNLATKSVQRSDQPAQFRTLDKGQRCRAI